MNKRVVKILSFLLIVMFIIMSATTVFALEPDKITGNGTIGDNQIGTIGNNIATIVRSVGVVAAVVILMIIGIRYMMGSAEEKAEYKKVMIPYVIGAVILFSASIIVPFLVDIGKSLTS